MPKYDRQLIIQFLTGDPGDALIKNNARALDKKARNSGLKSTIVTMPYKTGVKHFFNALKTFRNLTKVTATSRVYLQGHGNWQTQKLGNWDGIAVADEIGQDLQAVKTISILGCNLGRDLGTAGTCRVAHSADSFASKFHARIRSNFGIETVVYARVESLGVISPWQREINSADAQQVVGEDLDEDDDFKPWVGKKYTFTPDGTTAVHKQTKSKLMYWWENGQQKRAWLAY